MVLGPGVGEGGVVGEWMEIEVKRSRKGEGESSSKTVPVAEEALAGSSGMSNETGLSSEQIAWRRLTSWSRAGTTCPRSSTRPSKDEQYVSSISPSRLRQRRILRNLLCSDIEPHL